MEDQFEEIALEIRLGLEAYDSNLLPSDPLILQPDLHVQPCPVCDKFRPIVRQSVYNRHRRHSITDRDSYRLDSKIGFTLM
jgi:hypothetical protein